MLELDYNTAKFLVSLLTREPSGLTEDEITEIRAKLYERIHNFYPGLVNRMLKGE